ncbi:MAG: hypothetical protein LIP28_03970 [Deltaproteobacteria bacterium]|nr:hypothetical protein [Deltaproteobacteria bacterium]
MDFEYVDNTPELKTLLSEIFTDSFMRAHTNFDNFRALQYSSAVIVNWDAEQMVYSKALLDSFVKESTQFSSWEELVQAATDQRYPAGGAAD